MSDWARRAWLAVLTLRRRLSGELAQSVTELALTLPFLTWMLLGAVDFARVYYLQAAVMNAANTGAQFGIDWRRSANEVRAVVRQEAAPLINIDDASVTLSATPSWGPGSRLQVVVVQDFHAMTPLVSGLWGGGSLQVRGTSIVRFNP